MIFHNTTVFQGLGGPGTLVAEVKQIPGSGFRKAQIWFETGNLGSTPSSHCSETVYFAEDSGALDLRRVLSPAGPAPSVRKFPPAQGVGGAGVGGAAARRRRHSCAQLPTRAMRFHLRAAS